MYPRSAASERSEVTRRRILAITVGIVGLAGCAGDEADTPHDDDEDADSAGPDEGDDEDGTTEADDDREATTDDVDDEADGDSDPRDDTADDESIDEAVGHTLDTYWATLRDGDAETFRSQVHEDSPLRDESWWEDDEYWEELDAVVEFDVSPIDRTIVDQTETEVVVLEETAVTLPDEPDGVATIEFTLRLEDDAWLLYDVEEVAWDEDRDADAERVIEIDVSGDAAAFLGVAPAEQIDDRYVTKTDEGSAIVLDPDGKPLYNENARTRFDAFLVLENHGSKAVETLVPELTVTGTADDAAHERAITFLIDDEPVALDGETDLLVEALDPGEVLSVGLELDLLDSGIEDIEPQADMRLAFVAE